MRYLLLMLVLIGSSNLGFAQRTILITAATSELGTVICHKLAAHKASLILAGRSPSKLEALRKILEKQYKSNPKVMLFDYTQLESIQRLGECLKEPLDGIVLIPPRPNLSPKSIPSDKEWQTALKEGFIGPVEVVRHLSGHLKEEGAIVVVSGITSVHFLPQYANSNVLRIMWIAEVKNLMVQLASQKIRVNAISPGLILTEHNIKKIKARAEQEKRTYEQQLVNETKDIPLQKYGEPDDVAESVLFLLSQEAKHINGINMVLDGGVSQAY